ncbi:MAG TPA: N-acetyltransferase [Actinobacteria bacterium]|nr:N-acetyltransferase [Actinomycetota bacterium]
MGYKIHHTAEVQSKNIGGGTIIWQFCVVLKDASIGENCNINCNVFIENDVIIGNNVTIKPGVQIWDGLRIEDDVFIGPNATFTNDLLPRSKQYPDKFIETYIRKGASIGANATILAGVEIGEYAMIGAGSVVTKDVPPFTLWVGNPARQKGHVTKEGNTLDLNLMNKQGKVYRLVNNEPLADSQPKT